MTSFPILVDSPFNKAYIFSTVSNRSDAHASRTIIRNPWSGVYEQRDYAPLHILSEILNTSTTLADNVPPFSEAALSLSPKSNLRPSSTPIASSALTNARAMQDFTQWGDAIVQAKVAQGGTLVSYYRKSLYVEDVIIPIIEGACDLRLITTYLPHPAVATVCWIACDIIDMVLKGVKFEFVQMLDPVNACIAGMVDVPPQPLPHYTRGIAELLFRAGRLMEKLRDNESMPQIFMGTLASIVDAVRDDVPNIKRNDDHPKHAGPVLPDESSIGPVLRDILGQPSDLQPLAISPSIAQAESVDEDTSADDGSPTFGKCSPSVEESRISSISATVYDADEDAPEDDDSIDNSVSPPFHSTPKRPLPSDVGKEYEDVPVHNDNSIDEDVIVLPSLHTPRRPSSSTAGKENLSLNSPLPYLRPLKRPAEDSPMQEKKNKRRHAALSSHKDVADLSGASDVLLAQSVQKGSGSEYADRSVPLRYTRICLRDTATREAPSSCSLD